MLPALSPSSSRPVPSARRNPEEGTAGVCPKARGHGSVDCGSRAGSSPGVIFTNFDWLADHTKRHGLTVAMRSGFMSFFAHAGMYFALRKRLQAAGLPLPALVGVSSGGIAAWLLASGLSDATVVTIMASLKRLHFFDESSPLGFSLSYLRHGYFCEGSRYRAHLQDVVQTYGAASTLEECTPPVTLVVTSMKQSVASRAMRFWQSLKRLFATLMGYDVWAGEPNYECHTLRRGPTPDVVRATSALPELFKPVRLPTDLVDRECELETDEYIDGGWGDPLGVTAWRDSLEDGAVLVLHTDTASTWDRPPWNAFVGVPETALPDHPNLHLCDLGQLPTIDPIWDLLIKGDLSSGARIIEAAEQKMDQWLSAPYRRMSAHEMNTRCLPSYLQRHKAAHPAKTSQVNTVHHQA